MPDKFEVWLSGGRLYIPWFCSFIHFMSALTWHNRWNDSYVSVGYGSHIYPGPYTTFEKGRTPQKHIFFRGWPDKPVLSHSKWAVKFLFSLQVESVSLVASHSSRRNGLFLLRGHWLLAVIFWLNTNETQGSQDGCEKFQIWQQSSCLARLCQAQPVSKTQNLDNT